MISVLVPVRDAAKTVRLAIRSTLRALPDGAEILIVDDGSHDDTADIVKAESRRDPRVRLAASTSGIGVADSLNLLLDAAHHDLIARMDGDDASLPWRFQVQLREMKAGADVVFSTRVNFGPSLKSFRPGHAGQIPAKQMPYWLALTNPNPHSSLFTRKATLRQAGGYVAGPAEDYALWMRLASRGTRIVRSAVPCIGYRMHAGQVTKSTEWAMKYASDPDLRSSHAELAQSLGWSRPGAWQSLTQSDASDLDERSRFVDHIRASAPAKPALGAQFFAHAAEKVARRRG